MVTDKQINASGLNGKKVGPKTPADAPPSATTRSSTASPPSTRVLPVLENSSGFDIYLDHLRHQLQPVGIIEHMLVDQIADAY